MCRSLAIKWHCNHITSHPPASRHLIRCSQKHLEFHAAQASARAQDKDLALHEDQAISAWINTNPNTRGSKPKKTMGESHLNRTLAKGIGICDVVLADEEEVKDMGEEKCEFCRQGVPVRPATPMLLVGGSGMAGPKSYGRSEEDEERERERLWRSGQIR